MGLWQVIFLLRLKFESCVGEWASLSAQPEQLCVRAAFLFFDFCIIPTNSCELFMAASRGVITYYSGGRPRDLCKSWDRSPHERQWITVVNDLLSLS